MKPEYDQAPEEVGEVIEVRGDLARVRVLGNKACAHCGVCTRVSENEMVVEARSSEPVSKGDRVVLLMERGMVVRSAFIVYMVPLIALIGGYMLGKRLAELLGLAAKGELFPALFGFLCVFLSFLAIRWYDRRKRNDSRFQVRIRKVGA